MCVCVSQTSHLHPTLQLPTPNQSLLDTRKFTLVPRSTRCFLACVEHGALRLECLLLLLVLELLLDTGIAICFMVSRCAKKPNHLQRDTYSASPA